MLIKSLMMFNVFKHSRLNRTKTDKTVHLSSILLILAEITAAFEPHYTTTILDGETDDQELYNKKTNIEQFHLFTQEDPKHFCKIYFDKKRKDSQLQPPLNQVVERWAAIDDEERRRISANTKLYKTL